MIIQVCELDQDYFYEIEEDELLRIRKLPLEERDEAFREVAKVAKVSTTSEVDAVLCLDGENDEESWQELDETVGWEV